MSVYLFICFILYLSLCVSVYVYICLSVYLFICLSFDQITFMIQELQFPNLISLLIPVVYLLTLKQESAHPLHVQEGEMEQDTSALDHVLVSSKISKRERKS